MVQKNSINDKLIEKIRNYVRHLMQDAEPGHNFLHISRVHQLAKHIAQKEKADILVVEAAALLHDIGRPYELRNPKINHADKSTELALPFLKTLVKVGFPSDKINPVLYAIKNHRFTKGIIPKTIEAQVLQDADKLDAIGAVGIMRCFSHGTAKKRLEYNPDDPVCKKRLKNKTLEFEDKKYSIDHFYRKLFKLRGRMFTKTAKSIASKREKIMELFLNELGKEIDGKDLFF